MRTRRRPCRAFVITAAAIVLSAGVAGVTGGRSGGPTREEPQLVLQIGHAGTVRTLSFSPDGRWLASGGDDHIICLWDVATRQVLRRLRAHTAAIRTLAFSPDGSRLASGGDDGSILWDLRSGERLGEFAAPPGAVTRLTFSPDGRMVAAGSSWGTAVWEIATGSPVEALTVDTLGGSVLAFSPDARSLILLARDARHVDWWHLSARRQTRRIPLAAGGGDMSWGPSVVTTLVESGTLDRLGLRADLATLLGAAGGEQAVLSPGATLLAGPEPTDSHTIGIWEAATARQLHSLGGGAARASALAFSPDGRTLAVAGDGVTLWDVANGASRPKTGHGVEPLESVRFLPSTPPGTWSIITSAASGTEYRWPGDGGQLARTTYGARSRLHVGPGGSVLIVTAPSDSEEVVSASGRTVSIVKVAPDGNWALSSDGHLLAYTPPMEGDDAQATIRVRDLETGRDLHAFIPEAQRVSSLVFSGDNRLLLSTSWSDGVATIWDLTTGEKRLTVLGQEIEVSRDGTWLASYSPSPSSTIRLTNLVTGARSIIRDHGSMVFSPTSRYLATGHDGSVSVWEVETGRRVFRATPSGGSTGAKAFCPDERCIVIGSTEKSLQLWELSTGRPVMPEVAALAAIRWGHSFSSDMRWLGVPASDGGVDIWDLGTRTHAASLHVVNEGRSWLVSTPAGFFDASDDQAKSLIRWNVRNELHPVDRFSAQRFRPGLLSAILAGKAPVASREGGQR